MAALVGHRIWKGSRAPFGTRVRALLGLAWPFALGFAVPVAAFVVPYAVHGATLALVEGALILPGRRVLLATTSSYPPPVWSAGLHASVRRRSRGSRDPAAERYPSSCSPWPRRALLVVTGLLVPTENENVMQATMASVRHLPARRRAPRTLEAAGRRGRTPPFVRALGRGPRRPWYSSPFPRTSTSSIPLPCSCSQPSPSSRRSPLAERPGSVHRGRIPSSSRCSSSRAIASGRVTREPTARLATSRGGLRLPPKDVAEYDRSARSPPAAREGRRRLGRAGCAGDPVPRRPAESDAHDLRLLRSRLPGTASRACGPHPPRDRRARRHGCRLNLGALLGSRVGRAARRAAGALPELRGDGRVRRRLEGLRAVGGGLAPASPAGVYTIP